MKSMRNAQRIAAPTSVASCSGPARVALLPMIHHSELRKASAAMAAPQAATLASTARRWVPGSWGGCR
jgi:hypothetical protein